MTPAPPRPAPAFAFVAPCRVDGHDIVDALGATIVSTFNSDFGDADDAAHAALIARALNAAADPARGARIAALTAALQFDGIDRNELTIITGFKRSTRDAYIRRLKSRGLVEIVGQRVIPVDGAMDALGNYEPLPTGAALRQHWLERLPHGEARILSILCECYPQAVARTEIDDLTGFKRSTRDAYLLRLKTKRLVVAEGSSVSAAETLF